MLVGHYYVGHYYIQWTCNQTVEIISKILDIKKLTEMTEIDNERIHKGPIWDNS